MKFENLCRNLYLILNFYIHSSISGTEDQTVRVSVECARECVRVCKIDVDAGWGGFSSCLLHTCIFIMCLQNVMEAHNIGPKDDDRGERVYTCEGISVA